MLVRRSWMMGAMVGWDRAMEMDEARGRGEVEVRNFTGWKMMRRVPKMAKRGSR
jgi:hypothetical protein